MYVIMRKDGWFVYEITSYGCFCWHEFDVEQLICFKDKQPALALLSFIECFYPNLYDVVHIPATDPRICDLVLEDFYF